MSQAPPEPGDVIRHWYLWRHEANKGAEEAVKPRPCLVVATNINERDETKVFVAPITTQPTFFYQPHEAREIPLPTKQRLGLDDKPSWIITNEVNSFTWIGPDVERTPSGDFIYGAMPAGLVRQVQQDLAEKQRTRQLKQTSRDDQDLLERVRRMQTPSRDDDRER